MKGTIPTTEKECNDFLDEFRKYAAKRGIKVYSIIAYSAMTEATVITYPDPATLPLDDMRAYLTGFFDIEKSVHDFGKKFLKDEGVEDE